MNEDPRLGGHWTRRQRLKNDAIYGALRVCDAIARRAPRTWTEGALARLARGIVLRSPTAQANVLAVFPHWTDAARARLLERHAERLAVHAAAALAVAWGRVRPAPLALRADSVEVLDAALRRGRGVVLASAHLGAWERVAHTVAGRARFAAVTREPYDARLGRWLDAVRAPVATIPRGGAGAVRSMLGVLRGGGVLGIPMDLATRGVETTEAPFLGRHTAIVTGPARLAHRTGAALVVATYTHLDGRESLRIRPVEPAPVPAATTALLARALTEAILQCPEEWLWMHPRWTRSSSTPLYSAHGGWRATRT